MFTDAILAQKGQSVNYQKIQSQLGEADLQDSQAVISPRSNKHTKRKAE